MKKKLLSSEKIVKTFSFDVKSVKEDEYIVEGIFSTPDTDRHNEAVMQDGWKLENYLKKSGGVVESPKYGVSAGTDGAYRV